MCFAFQSVFVCVCAAESARNLLGVYSAPWPGLACPPTILWSCCWIGRLKMMHIEVFLFLCVGTRRQHCCRLFSLWLCLSASETKFDFPSLIPAGLPSRLFTDCASINNASPPRRHCWGEKNVRWPVWGGERCQDRVETAVTWERGALSLVFYYKKHQEKPYRGCFPQQGRF